MNPKASGMKRLMLCLLMTFIALTVDAQTSKELQETAKTFVRQGDFHNALMVLNRANQMTPNDPSIRKDLSLVHYYLKDYNASLNTILPLLDSEVADDQCFQIAGNIYKVQQNVKEAEKVYKKGLKKFPSSGALYNDYGELLWMTQQFQQAVAQWEKGIELDPSFPRNYYNAGKYYYFSTDRVWGLLYSEIYLNMEPNGSQAPEVKEFLLQGYKKLFTESDLLKNSKATESSFPYAYLITMNAQNSLTLQGINADVLTMIRTRFLLDWFQQYGQKFPYKLFEYQLQLCREGLFNAYNQWIFGSAQNLQSFQRWISTHQEEYDQFVKFQRSRVFKMPERQYYK